GEGPDGLLYSEGRKAARARNSDFTLFRVGDAGPPPIIAGQMQVHAMSASADITGVLADLGRGSPDAAERLLPIVHEELRRLANHYLSDEPRGQTLQPTALVHEAFLRLVGAEGAAWQGRAQFFAVAARAMRHLLIDHARRRRAAKRGGEWHKIPLEQIAE